MRLYYETGWTDPAVHYGALNSGRPWADAPLKEALGFPGWKVAELDAPSGAEFVVRNGDSTEWDNPPPEVGTKNYVIDSKGTDSWVLRCGRLSRVHVEQPVLIVSDLDGTMLGHEHDPEDALLKEFRARWLGKHALGGGRLVYSTGRNKEDALKVAVEKQLPRPAMLICAVGTEIYNVPESLPMSPEGAWAQSPMLITLDETWTNKMIAEFDRTGTEQLLRSEFSKFDVKGNVQTDPYRIPTVYQVDENFDADLQGLRERLAPSVQVISSGGAEWKFVDFCSSEAGKLKAMEFVIQRLSFSPDRTLACGDSGNDESMYRSRDVRCVAVGNSLPELVAALEKNALLGPDAVQKGSVFETHSGSQVLYAEKPCAGAIVEALDRFWQA